MLRHGNHLTRPRDSDSYGEGDDDSDGDSDGGMDGVRDGDSVDTSR